MKCLQKYGWVKLPRSCLPQGKGILGHWARLASRAAFRPGQARYCGFLNSVTAGMWAGGVVGLKSILGVKSRAEALRILDQLKSLGYLTYTLDFATKKLEYVITDWVSECSGAACSERTMYATAGYGFLCLPRNIPDRLAKQGIAFEEADAWLDLWCHTCVAGSEEYLFASGAHHSIQRCGSDAGDSWQPLGLGKDKGMEILSKAWGCIPSVPSSRFLRLSDMEPAVSDRHGNNIAKLRENKTHFCPNTHSGRKYAFFRQRSCPTEQDGWLV